MPSDEASSGQGSGPAPASLPKPGGSSPFSLYKSGQGTYVRWGTALGTGVIVVGAALAVGSAPPSRENVPGHIRGYDVRTGERKWIFHTIPVEGEFGNDTWEDGSWEYTGNAAVWPPFTVDVELGYVYLPVEDPTGDYYGGHRPGDNLFSSSLVALNIETGERIWNTERQFNLDAGFTKADDTLPKRILEEPAPSGTAKGKVVELDKMLPEYYKLRGWDEDGVPEKKTLKRLGL